MRAIWKKTVIFLATLILMLAAVSGNALPAHADGGEALVNTLKVTLKDGSDASGNYTDIALREDKELKLYVKGADYSDSVVTIIAGIWKYPNWSKQLTRGNEYTLSNGTITLYGKKIYKKIGENRLTLQINLPGGQRRWVFVNIEKAPVVPKAVAFNKVISGKKTITVKWKKGKNASGYEVQCSTKKNFKRLNKFKQINKKGTTSFKFKGLKSGKKYYVRIRSFYKHDGDFTFSKWSKVKTVKVK